MFKVGDEVIITNEEDRYIKYIRCIGIIISKRELGGPFDWDVKVKSPFNGQDQTLGFSEKNLKLSDNKKFNESFENHLK